MDLFARPIVAVMSLFTCMSFSASEALAENPTKQITAKYKVLFESDVSYLGANRLEKLDLYLPKDLPKETRVPAVVIIHGGGWFGGDKARARQKHIGNTLAAHGYVTVSINYKLANKSVSLVQRLRESWPQNLYDCKTAVRWLRKNADKYQIDSKHIGVIGGSAGGHLAAMVALTRPSDGLDPAEPYSQYSSSVQAAVPMYGPCDLALRTKNKNHVAKLSEEDRKLLHDASPISYIRKNSTPILLLHGSQDKTVSVQQTELFDAELAKAGVSHQTVIIEGAGHSFHLQPKQRDLRPIVLAFFDKHLKKGN